MTFREKLESLKNQPAHEAIFLRNNVPALLELLRAVELMERQGHTTECMDYEGVKCICSYKYLEVVLEALNGGS